METLPTEILELIFARLPIRSFPSLSLISRTTYAVFDEQGSFWETIHPLYDVVRDKSLTPKQSFILGTGLVFNPKNTHDKLVIRGNTINRPSTGSGSYFSGICFF